MIVCSSGIACTIHGNETSTATTVHAYFGLETAELSWERLLERSLSKK